MPQRPGTTGTTILDRIRKAALLLALAAPHAVAGDLDRVIAFEIAAQPLDRALIAFSEQSNVQLMVATELVANLASPGVDGGYSATDALTRILGANPLGFEVVGEDTIVVVSAGIADDSSRGVTSTAAGADTASQAGGDRDARTRRSAVAPSLYDDYRNTLDEIVVTGVRGRPRSVADSASPIDVFSSVAIEQGGRIGLFQSLQSLAPSFHLPTRAGGSTSTVIATAGLRGLNPDQTLVLVNGKRRHTTSLINAVALVYNGSVPADLDHIPMASVERIEVLRDGAAAQYGSDAIAGVVNVILKNDATGGSVKVLGGRNYDRGDGEQREVSGYFGLPLGRGGFVGVSASVRDQAASNRAVPIDAAYPLYYPLADGSPDPREQSADRLVTKNFGMFPMSSHSLALNASLPLTDRIELYGFGTLGQRSSILNWTFREPNDPNNIDAVYPDGFRPRLEIDENDHEVAIGARGRAGDWLWDLTSLFGGNTARRDASRTINSSLGPASPTEFYVGELASTDWITTLDLTRSFSLDAGELQASWGAQHHRERYEISPGDPASYAAGDWVFPDGHPRAGQQPAPGAQANHGITPADASDASRDSLAVYGELGWAPISRLYLSLAARYEVYDDTAGDALVGKLSARYSVSDRLAVRLTASSGFRAPPLAQQQYASTTSQFRDLDGDASTDLLLIKQLPPDSPAAVALGALPLKPEASVNLSVGATFKLLDGLSVTADAYRIDLDDRISITSTLDGPEVAAILAANGLSPALSGQYYSNAIDTTTEGIDLVATWARDIGAAGSLALNLGVNVNHTSIDRIAPNPPELDVLGPDFVLFDRLRLGNLTYGLPDYKAVLSANWLIGNLDTNLRVTRFGGYRSVSNNADAEVDIAAEDVIDIDVSYAFSERWFLTVGANNLLNAYPTRVRAPTERRGSGQYDTRGGFGFTGGFYFARLDFRF